MSSLFRPGALLRVLTPLVLVSLPLSFAPLAQADTLWPDLRDGVIHIRKTGAASLPLQLAWQGAWIPESQEERVYFQNPDGSLIRRVVITPDRVSGTESVTTATTDGDYRVEIPGASFRFYQLLIPGTQASMFEPVKLHQSARVSSDNSFYFRVPANQTFMLCGKYYGGVDALTITPVSGGNPLSLSLTSYADNEYARYDSVSVPAASQERIFRLNFDGSGKISFWLDGIPNLFAQQAGELFALAPIDASTRISIGNAAGEVPAVGAALPFAEPPTFTYSLLDEWAMQATSYYFFQDTLSNNLDADKTFLTTYQTRFNLRKAVSILSNTGRQPLIEDTASTATFLQAYLKRRHEEGLLNDAYIAFADEPNLNYSNVSEFEDQFVTLATTIKHHSDPAISATRIAAPQSSRFWNGPTRDGAAERRGSDMAERLLANHYDLFDALSWHEWQVRDLIATDWYYDSITRAYQLMKRYQPAGQPEKKLVIAQTNISSGYSLSPYEQDTFFASLWWTSVVAQSARTGKLSSLIWFKAADDGLYNKGLVSLGSSSYTRKPASDAMRFVSRHLGTASALTSESNHPEVDAVGTLNSQGLLQVLGVNKGEHRQQITLTLTRSVRSITVSTLDESGSNSYPLTVNADHVVLQVPPRTLFAIDEDKTASPPQAPVVRIEG